MSSTADRSSTSLHDDLPEPLAPADGLDLLGAVDGSGYEQGAALVRRADGQMVQLGPLTYALLEEVDGHRDTHELSEAMCEKLGRDCDEQVVAAIAEKLAAQGLLAGSEDNAPERSNPLLALRWKVVVTDPDLTSRLTAPFTGLFRPWILWPVLAAFAAAAWFVLVEQGLASGAAQAFAQPELILLLFALGIASAGFHELGHAAACRYGGGHPGAIGAGIYIVWPAFYTDVTDAYRLPTRDRLRTDFGGLYFNAIVAVATLAAWLVLRVDALLLLIALLLVEMVKQLSPIIRADGYHILSDATGVPDLYAHIGPTLRRLVPGRGGEPSALTGRARLLVTAWVLLIVPILLGIALGVILLLPRLIASAWASGSNIVAALPAQAGDGQVVELAVSALRLVGLALPVLGAGYIAWRVLAGAARRAAAWSAGRPARRALAAVLAAAVTALLVWAWWPAGQYEPIRASDRGSIRDAAGLVASEPASARTAAADTAERERPAPTVPHGDHIAVGLIPEGGATETEPAIFIITDPKGGAPTIIATSSAPAPGEPAADTTPEDLPTSTAVAFNFDLPDAPREGDSQALAVNRTDGGTTYSISYSLVTVRDGDAVDNQNSAHAYANCNACTTVAISFQVVLVVGTSPLIAPINFAEAINGNCLECVTTAIANQLVLSVAQEPSEELLGQIQAELERLDALGSLGADATPQQLITQVAVVQEGIRQLLSDSGLLTNEQATQEATSTTPETTTTDGTTTEPAIPEGTTDGTATDPSTGDTTTSDPATTDPTTDPATTTTTVP